MSVAVVLACLAALPDLDGGGLFLRFEVRDRGLAWRDPFGHVARRAETIVLRKDRDTEPAARLGFRLEPQNVWDRTPVYD